MELSNEAKEEFLRTAVTVKASRAGKGVTESWRVSLEGSGMTHAASFQSVDERAFIKDLGNGVKELHFVGGMGEVYRARDTKLGRDGLSKSSPRSSHETKNAWTVSSEKPEFLPR